MFVTDEERKRHSQQERWFAHCEELRAYVKENRRLPSRHRVEDRRLLNWLKYNRRCFANNTLPPDRMAAFVELKAFCAPYLRLNQHAYRNFW